MYIKKGMLDTNGCKELLAHMPKLKTLKIKMSGTGYAYD